MNLWLNDLTEAYAKEICDWKYDGEYSIYNYPDWNKVLSEKWAIANDEKREMEFSAVVDDNRRLCGYFRLINKDDHVLIGLGLKPSLCGQGLGNAFMELLMQMCANMYPNKKLVLEVRAFNKRAVKCYEKAGFKTTDIYKKDTPIGSSEFLRMEFNY